MRPIQRATRMAMGAFAALCLLVSGCDADNPLNVVKPARGFYSLQTSNFVSTCDTADSGRQFTQFVRLFGTPLTTQIVYANDDGDCQTFNLERSTDSVVTWTRIQLIEAASGLCTMRRTWNGELTDLGNDQLMLEDSWTWEIETGDPADCAADFPDLDSIPCDGSETASGMSVDPSDWPGCF